MLQTIWRQVRRLLRRRGLEPADEGTGAGDPLAEASVALAGIVGASVEGRVALGPRQARLEGFDLRANVWVGAIRAGSTAGTKSW